MNRVVDRYRSPVVFFALLFVVATSAMPASAGGPEPVGSGHITAGVFNAHPYLTWSIGLGPGVEDLPYEFTLDAVSHQGATIEALVEDNTGAGYFVKMAFYDEGRRVDADCAYTEDSHGIVEPPFGTAELRPRCVVPSDAEIVVVYAHTGVDLDVTVIVA